MYKRGIAFEQLVKIILALIVLVVVIAVFYALMKPAINSMLGIEDDSSRGGGGILDDLFKAFGKTCEEGKIECNPVSNTKRECRDGAWETTDEPCDE